MNSRRRITLFPRAFVFVAILAATGCQLIEFTQVRRDFNAAVASDNQRGLAFADPYAVVLDQLDPGFIAGLDDRLRPTAWMMRAVAQWRTGDGIAAQESALQGLAEPRVRPGSRDQIVLTLIPAMTIDSELQALWRTEADGPSPDAARFAAENEPKFRQAMDGIEAARALVGQPTPPEVGSYVLYQRWRLVQNWRFVVRGIDDEETRKETIKRAAAVLGEPTGGLTSDQLEQLLAAVAGRVRDSIPASSPLRDQIRLEGGG